MEDLALTLSTLSPSCSHGKNIQAFTSAVLLLILIRPLKAIAIQVTGDLSKGERSYHNNNYYCSGYSVSVVYNNIAV